MRAEAAGGSREAQAPSAAEPSAAAGAPHTTEIKPTTAADVVYSLPRRAGRPCLDEVKHRVACGVSDIHHISNWCSADEEAELMRCVDGAAPERWTPLRGRRLQSLGGLPKAPPEMMSREPLPHWVQSVCDSLVACGAFPAELPPNHVLLNEYQPGEGIDAHKDGPIYAPCVAILSLNSHATFQFLDDSPERAPAASLLLPPRGVLVFRRDAYEGKLHRVTAVEEDELSAPGLVRLGGIEEAAAAAAEGFLPRGRRVSLTVRHVLRSVAPHEPPPALPVYVRGEICRGALLRARENPCVNPADCQAPVWPK